MTKVARVRRAAGRLDPKSGALAVRLTLLAVTLAFAPGATSATSRVPYGVASVTSTGWSSPFAARTATYAWPARQRACTSTSRSSCPAGAP